jgi:hypothetical protein
MFGKFLIIALLALWTWVLTTLALRGEAGGLVSSVGGVEGVAGELRTELPKSAVRPRLVGLPFRSGTMQLQRTDWIERYEHSIDEVAAIGADTVMFVVDPRMEHGESNLIYLDMRKTPTPDALKRLVGHAKGKNLRVILMPIVLLDAPRKSTEWRGTIKPESWDVWFQSYTEMMTHFAWIAQASGVDMLVVGSELVSTEKQTEQWRKVIAHVRGIFKGKLTYSANWDHYSNVPFWDQLDLIGMNSYWSLDEGKKNKAEIGDIKQAWRDIQEDLLPFAAGKGMPIVFLEAGWCSISNAAHEPWDYTRSDLSIDFDLQRRLYEGFFQSWHGNPQLGGFSIWEWTPTPDRDDREAMESERRGYTPEGKPAEAVVREYFALPPWQVDPNPANGRPR